MKRSDYMIKEIKDDNNPFLFHLQYFFDNKLIGMLDYSLIYNRIEIENIEVNENYRRKHIASFLMDYLVKKSTENITLEVNINNYKAINLYEKYGFKKVAIRKNYYGNEDAVLMERK